MQRITQNRVRIMKRKPSTTSNNKKAGYRAIRPYALYRAFALLYVARLPFVLNQSFCAGGSGLICLHTGGSTAHSVRLWIALTVPPISHTIGNASGYDTSVRLAADLTLIRNLFIPSCRTLSATATF